MDSHGVSVVVSTETLFLYPYVMKKLTSSFRSLSIVAFSCFIGHAAIAQSDPAWDASAGLRYVSRNTAYGLDLSASPALGFSADLAHQSGLSLEIGALQTLGSTGELQHWSLGAGYEAELGSMLTFNASFTHTSYSSDTANVLAGLSNSLGVGLEADLEPVSIGLSYDMYLGGNGAAFVSFDASSFQELGPMYVVPLVQLTFVSQEVESTFLKGGKKSGGTAISSPTTVTGLSSLSLHMVFLLPITDGFTATLHPYYLYSPSDLSETTSRFVWTLGVRYSVEW